MADKKRPTGDYEVGYCRPPTKNQIRKGERKNPKGRPKSKKSGSTDVSALLDEPVRVTSGGKARDMPPFEVGFRKLAQRALNGDLPAILKFVKICEEYGVIAPPPAEIVGGVIHAPKGVSCEEWLERVAEWVPVDEA